MRRRGLTLLEVLAATVLLTVLAGTCVPLVRAALPALRPPDRPFALLDLARVADSVVAEPAQFELGAFAEISERQITWPDQPHRPPITVRLITPGEPDVDHRWLAFSCGDWTVHRWIPLELDEIEDVP